jgi:hypothetical protein
MWQYLIGIGIGLDITTNATLGGDHYQTLSCRIGESIQSGGWASYVPWPNWLRQHFLNAVFETTV